MGKTHTTYLAMILAFSLGLWGILRVGNHLHAARNVAGEWQVATASNSSQLPDRLTVTQSGKFLNATLHEAEKSGGVRFRGLLQGEGTDAGRIIVLKATAPVSTITATLNETGQTMTGQLDSGTSAGWQATRMPPPSPR